VPKHVKFTDLTLRALREPGSYWDESLPAFGLRVGKRAKTFIVVREGARKRLGRWRWSTRSSPAYAGPGTTPVTWPAGARPQTKDVHVDHLNRPIKMTTSTKASVWDAVWQPWGNVHTVTGTAVLDARFPGQWFQLETGLHYNWHRSYDPTIGRYTQPDPLGFVDGPSVYGYARGAPQALVDRDGRFAFVIPPAKLAGDLAVIIAAAVMSKYSKSPVKKPKSPTPIDSCPANDDDNGVKCRKASDYQIRQAKIIEEYGSEHKFKNEHGATPESHYEICACDDGSIRIAARGQCNAPGPKIYTGYRWR
jgi:RHS repeat-associated protein